MKEISSTLCVLQFILLILQVFSYSRENRLIGATQLTKEQTITNHKGSASVALGYNDGVKRFQTGVVIAPDTFLTRTFGNALDSVVVSNLVLPLATNPPVADGEVYQVTSPPTPYNGNKFIVSMTFEQLKSDTKAVPATLAPAGTLPLPEETEGCIAYTYGTITPGDTNPDHQKLAYLPLTVLADKECGSSHDYDPSKYFCAGVSYDGKSPWCSTLDFPMVAFCPVSTFGNAKSVKPNLGKGKEKWCHRWWWSWWCLEEEDLEDNGPQMEEKWVLVGISAFNVPSVGCGRPGIPIIAFYYTN